MLSVVRNYLFIVVALFVAIPTPSHAGPIVRGLHAVGAVTRGVVRGAARVVGATARAVGRVAVGVGRGLRRTALFFHYRRPVRRAVAFAFGYRPCGGFACGRLAYY